MPIETLNEIHLVRQLGHGFFGVVHEATLSPHGVVAVKIIECARLAAYLGIPVTDWPAIRDALFAEADSLRKSEHSHVVRVHGAQYDAAKDNGYIVTELCEGSVACALESGPMSLVDVNRYLRHALTGLESMHGRGLVHRDLKPPNILIKGGIAKLSDFGLVTDRLIAGYASAAGYTEFQAPEIRTTRLTSSRTDVWAMGLTAYQMLNGLPWYLEVLKSLGADKIADPTAARRRIVQLVDAGGFALRLPFMPHVPDGWRRFVRKAMHDDSHQRFDDASTMLSAISSRALPVAPSYECAFAPNGVVTWRRSRAPRREEVIEWTRGPKRDHEILAQLRPVGGAAGRTTTQRRQQTMTRSEAIVVLQAFFEARKK
jgi:serine/threonine protein kinase